MSGTRSLPDWLEHISGLHEVGIDLGLARITEVAQRMGFAGPDFSPAPRTVIVAGTNGKGSTCVALEALLRAAGMRVGTTLSPHVHRFNERVRLDGAEASDPTLCAAFERVEAARGEVPLTYFEFSALVALDCFRDAAVDAAVLEVGLGGRLDAFNLVGADVAVVTSIGLDHQAYLGHDLEQIGREKAGVLRPGRPAVIGAQVTESVVQTALQLGCPVARLGVDFHVRRGPSTWDYVAATGNIDGIPLGALAPDNLALAIAAAGRFIDPVAHAPALGGIQLTGRMECATLPAPWGSCPVLLDVAHNPAAARFLATELERRHPGRRYVAVLGMLADKDAAGVAAALTPQVRAWVCVPTRGDRGLAAAELARRLAVPEPRPANDVAEGLSRALSWCRPGDGILALGSFDLVEQMRETLRAVHPRDAARAAELPLGARS